MVVPRYTQGTELGPYHYMNPSKLHWGTPESPQALSAKHILIGSGPLEVVQFFPAPLRTLDVSPIRGKNEKVKRKMFFFFFFLWVPQWTWREVHPVWCCGEGAQGMSGVKGITPSWSREAHAVIYLAGPQRIISSINHKVQYCIYRIPINQIYLLGNGELGHCSRSMQSMRGE